MTWSHVCPFCSKSRQPHRCTHIDVHSDIHMNIQTYPHRCTHITHRHGTDTHKHMHTQRRTHRHTEMHTQAHTDTRIHKCIHITHSIQHTDTGTHTGVYTCYIKALRPLLEIQSITAATAMEMLHKCQGLRTGMKQSRVLLHTPQTSARRLPAPLLTGPVGTRLHQGWQCWRRAWQ